MAWDDLLLSSQPKVGFFKIFQRDFPQSLGNSWGMKVCQHHHTVILIQELLNI